MFDDVVTPDDAHFSRAVAAPSTAYQSNVASPPASPGEDRHERLDRSHAAIP